MGSLANASVASATLVEDGNVVLIDDDTFLFQFDLLFSKFSYPNPSARIKLIVSLFNFNLKDLNLYFERLYRQIKQNFFNECV